MIYSRLQVSLATLYRLRNLGRLKVGGRQYICYLCGKYGELAHLARALQWHCRGDRFESGILHFLYILGLGAEDFLSPYFMPLGLKNRYLCGAFVEVIEVTSWETGVNPVQYPLL